MTVEIYFLIWILLSAISLKRYWWDGPVNNPAGVVLIFSHLDLVVALDNRRTEHQKKMRENHAKRI